MRGTVKFFNSQKGWGFISTEEKDVFVHYKQIQMDGFRMLDESDIVEFEIGNNSSNSREQAINVQPVLTLSMVKDALKEEGLYLSRTANTDAYKLPWMVVDENNAIQTSENGMSLVELAAFAGIDIEGLED